VNLVVHAPAVVGAPVRWRSGRPWVIPVPLHAFSTSLNVIAQSRSHQVSSAVKYLAEAQTEPSIRKMFPRYRRRRPWLEADDAIRPFSQCGNTPWNASAFSESVPFVDARGGLLTGYSTLRSAATMMAMMRSPCRRWSPFLAVVVIRCCQTRYRVTEIPEISESVFERGPATGRRGEVAGTFGEVRFRCGAGGCRVTEQEQEVFHGVSGRMAGPQKAQRKNAEGPQNVLRLRLSSAPSG
jgi:hypothetical protein